MKRKTSI